MKQRFSRCAACSLVMLLVVLWLALMAPPAFSAESTKYIRNDSTGGDCTSIGTWIWWGDSGRCTLNRDLTFAGNGIVIVDNNIELKGDGHTITGNKTGNGITMSGISGATVYDIRVDSFYTGLHLSGGNGNYIMWGSQYSNNTFAGVYLLTTSSNLVEANTMKANGRGIIVNGGSQNAVINNTVESSSTIGIQGSGQTTGNFFQRNTVRNNGTGIFLNDSPGNYIYQNNFLNNVKQAQVGSLGGRPYDNFFNYPLPTGGNYWSNFDTPGEGCSDANADGFCDSAYIITGSRASDRDELPRTNPFV